MRVRVPLLALFDSHKPCASKFHPAITTSKEDAFSVAVKSGADLTTLKVREYPLNKVAICIYVVLVLVVLGVSVQDELKYVYPLSRF